MPGLESRRQLPHGGFAHLWAINEPQTCKATDLQQLRHQLLSLQVVAARCAAAASSR
jgi:hypothetical protein